MLKKAWFSLGVLAICSLPVSAFADDSSTAIAGNTTVVQSSSCLAMCDSGKVTVTCAAGETPVCTCGSGGTTDSAQCVSTPTQQ